MGAREYGGGGRGRVYTFRYIVTTRMTCIKRVETNTQFVIVQELCESRDGRPGLSVLTSLLVSVDVKLY